IALMIGQNLKRALAEDLVDDVFSVVLAKSLELNCDYTASKHRLIGCALSNLARNQEPDRGNCGDHHEWNGSDHLPLKAMPQLQIHDRLLSWWPRPRTTQRRPHRRYYGSISGVETTPAGRWYCRALATID